ncbi:sensor histidine kinase [Arcticibacterium luteifluviistationis]|uniref:histidine kinase n=1 Tax=Arcticibacterium luteifluviistationis TaxID=1784714 RepID=A0A2Z4G746_9BACT|nr:ATP-binding protein [Arcticibacterium luteifluviistationis]AWV96981.1 histidine kinase [Arcticibacterium luteifluviistationis]
MLNFLIILLGSIFIRRRFSFAQKFPKLNAYLKISWIVALAIFLLQTSFENITGFGVSTFGYLILAFVFYCYWLVSQNPLRDPVLWAAVAYFLVSLVSDISEASAPDLYETYDTYLSIGVFASFVSLMAFGIGVSNQQKALKKEQEKNETISKKKDELEKLVSERTIEILEQKESLVIALNDLKATQSQLIQSEKLASLGELTAGIAHEIQNPLNFVNNFSELTKELAEELEEESVKSDDKRDIALEKELLQDIKDNLSKIYHHGNRASSIVKSMLEHSRSSSGIKEMVELNKICDEYIRLSYHGLRAKDKSFNSDFKTILDPKVENLEVVPQDFGRVLLNILNNAFHAVKSMTKNNIEGYKPIVTIATEKLKDKIKITIKDNGIGISEENKLKIFQPFFTTKPSGEGTGLGLSLSHDIIIAHGGEIELKSKPNEGSEFILTLPITLEPIKLN